MISKLECQHEEISLTHNEELLKLQDENIKIINATTKGNMKSEQRVSNVITNVGVTTASTQGAKPHILRQAA